MWYPSFAAEAVTSKAMPKASPANYLCQPESAGSVTDQRPELQECIPASFEVEHGVFVANVLDQQNLLGAVFHRTSGKIQLVREVQDGSSTSGFDGYNKLFSFSNTGQHVGIILPGKNIIIICGDPNMVKLTVKGKVGVYARHCAEQLRVFLDRLLRTSSEVLSLTVFLLKGGRADQVLKPIN